MGAGREKCRGVLEFTLEWESGEARHTEVLHAGTVNFWRDCFPPGPLEDLAACQVGDSRTVELAPHHQPRDQRRVVRLRPSQFDGQGLPSPLPRRGRFYPQGRLVGVAGAFRESLLPCRALTVDADQLLFDLNHPLAGRALRITGRLLDVQPSDKERGGRCEDWLERLCADGPGMQARAGGAAGDFFADSPWRREDEEDDGIYYRQPRLVQHVDEETASALRRRHGQLLAPGMRVLDLMGSWTSHLPEDLPLGTLTVLGMNAEELARNPLATATVVQDLNRRPVLPFADASFDAVLCALSVEYLNQPLAVMREVARVLVPGGLFLLSFSNRWFKPKAVRIWTELHEFERMGLVLEYLHDSGCFATLATWSRRGAPRPDNDRYAGELEHADPLYQVWATRR